MKKLTLFIFMTAIAIFSYGQSQFYKKYSAYEGMTKVYVSPSMFSLFDEGNEINISGNVNISKVTKKLSGLYILSTENPKYITEMRSDFEKLIKAGTFEMLMEMEEGDEKCVIYVSKNRDIITDMYICANDGSEFNIIYLTGEITQEDMKGLVADMK